MVGEFMRIAIGLGSVLLAVLALWWLGRDLLPPRSVQFAAGGSGSGYWAIAEQYKAVLARDGIEVEIVETSGSVENASLLAENGAQVALIQGGVQVPGNVETLGAVFFEPMFFIASRDAVIPRNPGLWRGLKIAEGGPGSGTVAAFNAFQTSVGLAKEMNEHFPLGGNDAVEALVSGSVDIAVFVAPLNAPYLEPLYADPEYVALPLDYITAVSRGMQQTDVITVPAAGVSFDPVVPHQDVETLGMVAHLVAREDIHPALVDRLVMAAREIHSGADAITRSAQFPSNEAGSLPKNAHAADLIEQGPNPLLSMLPYWIAAQIGRVAILVLPVVFIILPLIRTLPGLYAWQMRSRVYRHYSRIREIDLDVHLAGSPGELDELEQRLEDADLDLTGVKLPASFRDRAYSARLHIEHVRLRIERRRAEFAEQARV